MPPAMRESGKMDQAESVFRTRAARAQGHHQDSRREVVEEAITIPARRKPGNCRRPPPFRLQYQPLLQSIRQRFRLPALISIPHCGRTSKLQFTETRNRSLTENQKVLVRVKGLEETLD